MRRTCVKGIIPNIYEEESKTYHYSAIRLRENNIGKQEPDPTAKPSESNTHKFHVEAGEIAYIETFVVGGPRPYAVKEVYFDLPEVQSALEDFPDVSGEIVERGSATEDGWPLPEWVPYRWLI